VRDDDRGGSHPLGVLVEEPEPPRHGAIRIQGHSTRELQAWICGNCGCTKLYTDNLSQLSQHYRRGRT